MYKRQDHHIPHSYIHYGLFGGTDRLITGNQIYYNVMEFVYTPSGQLLRVVRIVILPIISPVSKIITSTVTSLLMAVRFVMIFVLISGIVVKIFLRVLCGIGRGFVTTVSFTGDLLIERDGLKENILS